MAARSLAADSHSPSGPVRLAAGLLVLAVVLSPWAFGSVHAVSQAALLGLVLLAAALSLLARPRVPLPWGAAPLLLGLALGIGQLAPLPRGTLEAVSPKSFEFQRHLFESPPGLERGPSAEEIRRPVSLNPGATRHQLALLLLGTLAYLVAARTFFRPAAALALGGAVAANGAALVLFGLVQKLTWNQSLYWAVPLSQGGTPFGPFVNRNNAGGFLNLCLAGALALLFWALQDDSGQETSEGRWADWSGGFSAWERLRGGLESSIAGLTAGKAAALALTAWLVAGVLATLSRGAVIALIAAAAVTLLAAVAMRQRLGRLAALGLVALAGAGLVAWVGLSSELQTRFEPLSAGTIGEEVRPRLWREALSTTPDFWKTGGGLGTFRFVLEPYRRTLTDQHWYDHAENQYIEALLVGGVPGAALLISALALAGWGLARLVRLAARAGAAAQAAALGAVFALTSQAFQAAFDFGLYLPANMLLLAVWCGVAIGLAIVLAAQSRRPVTGLAIPGSAWLCSGVVGGLLLAGLPAMVDTWRLGRVELALRAATFGDLREPPDEAALEARLGDLTQVLPLRDDDALAHLRAAELWILLYRLRAQAQLQAEADPGVSSQQLREATSTGTLHRRAQQLAAVADAQGLGRLRSEAVVARHLLPARAHLARADRACPLLAKVHLGLAELVFLSADPRSNAPLLDRARRLAPADAQLLFHAGVLDWDAGREDRAFASWRQSWSLSPEYGQRILSFLGDRIDPARIASLILPAQPQAVVQFVRFRQGQGDLPERWADQLRQAAAELGQSGLPAPERLYVQGSLEALGGQTDRAIEHYTQAVALRPGELVWRHELARLLLGVGQFDAARRQALTCVQMAPRDSSQQQLLDEIENAAQRSTDPP
jgi:tetratricopeptide (TPR) repeat protein